jgi:hypothetical protein
MNITKSEELASVTPELSSVHEAPLSTGAIAGIVVGSVVALALIIGLCVGLLRKKHNNKALHS